MKHLFRVSDNNTAKCGACFFEADHYGIDADDKCLRWYAEQYQEYKVHELHVDTDNVLDLTSMRNCDIAELLGCDESCYDGAYDMVDNRRNEIFQMGYEWVKYVDGTPVGEHITFQYVGSGTLQLNHAITLEYQD